ncbi:hypothetical protein [Solemya elarraichensis gill symbiont]|uniref:Uncharacterized protein n=1 Tax=Solemya elarraichensis gill symbiont TaxID=1918949 RepID=A0A1T2KYM9_9GAMM|nr:hypothetical protein [Solemya elarraichensis gill symbiont]OOZ37967.1 hypothetical protein BOW52_09755 [Solemya elarraichensis gill symbiont]
MNDPRLPILPFEAPEYIRRLWQRLTELFRAQTPAAGWKDKEASISTAKVGGSDPPTWAVMIDGIYAYKFAPNKDEEVWLSFHMPHDIQYSFLRDDGTVQGPTLFPHVHWVSDGTDTGTVRFGIEYTMAKGYSQGVFPVTTTIYLEQASDGTANKHNIVETTDDNALLSESFETDALVLTRVFREGTHANDTLTDDVFILFVDLHYPSDGLNTNERNRNNTSGELPWTKKQMFES